MSAARREDVQDRCEEWNEAVEALDAAFPQGWRSGDRTTDGLTLLMARDLRRLVGAVFGRQFQEDQ